MSQKDYAGDLGTDPYNFKPYGLSDVYFSVDFHRYPNIPFKLDYITTANKDWTCGFASIYANTNFKSDCGNYIDYDRFGTKGYCIYCFNFGNEQNSLSDHITPKKLGYARLSLDFAQINIETLKVLVYAEFEETLSIDLAHNVECNYQL